MRGAITFRKLLADEGLTAEDLVGKAPASIEARRALILQLTQRGLNDSDIARLMGRDRTTIGYWRKPSMRVRKNEKRKALWSQQTSTRCSHDC